jgi:hypothetical protein
MLRGIFLSLLRMKLLQLICLLHVVKLKQSPINAYKPLMLWHLQGSKLIREHEQLRTTEHFICRKHIIKNLIKRYNFANEMPFQKMVKLPVSGSVVKLTCHDAKAIGTPKRRSRSSKPSLRRWRSKMKCRRRKIRTSSAKSILTRDPQKV